MARGKKQGMITLRRSADNQAAANKQMDAYEDAMDDLKEKTTSRRARRTFKNGWQWLRHTVINTRAYQWATGVFVLFLLSWAGLATFVMLDFSVRYLFGYVDKDREWYMVNAAMALAQSQAARALLAAHHARDAICVAVHTGIVQGSSAYAEIERVLAPALLATPFVRSVELSFSDSADLLVVGHRTSADGQVLVTMQSTAAECFLLGVEGCIDPPGHRGVRPEWFSRYAGLPQSSATGYGTSGGEGEPGTNVQVKSGWEDAPVLDPTERALDGSAVAWSPTYRLGFRCGAAAGRVALALGGLSGGGESGWFDDPRLGELGEVYLVDRGGAVLASRSPADLLTVSDGTLRFAYIWELRGKGWAGELRSSFSGTGGPVTEKQLLHGGLEQVALRQLPPPLDHFAIVVVAPDSWPFVNAPLYMTSAVSMGLATVPWTIGLAAAGVVFGRQWRANNELKAKDPSKDMRDAGSRASLSDSLSSWTPMRIFSGR